MILSYTHGREFVRQVRPLLDRHDPELLMGHLRRHWPNGSLQGLLRCGHDDAVKAALLCLSLTGTMADNPTVARLLHDDDAPTVALAERTLWSIWFRAGDDRANMRLMRAVRLIGRSRLDQAIASLTKLVSHWPSFAEGYNQRAIAYFLKGDYVCAIDDWRQAVRLNEHHFGVLAGLGHSYAALGHLHRALEAYYRTLEVHPKSEGIRQSIQQVRACLGRPRVPNRSQSTPS